MFWDLWCLLTFSTDLNIFTLFPIMHSSNQSEVKEEKQQQRTAEIILEETVHTTIEDIQLETKPDMQDTEDAEDTETPDGIIDKPEDDTAEDETKPEDEISESITEIEEIFQVSEDGVNWKTVKKITTITPRGTSEKIIVIGGI